MALTGLQIFKLLPQTNCKECGYPTCLAFAMKLAAKQVALDLCPYASDEAKSALGAASVPPIRKVTIGKGDHQIELGEEVVLFRHDKTFYHPTALALGVADNLADTEFNQALSRINSASYDRAGETIAIAMTVLICKSGNADQYANRAKAIVAASQLPVALICDDPALCSSAAEAISSRGGVLCGATIDTLDAFIDLATRTHLALMLKAETLEELGALAEKAAARGFEEIILAPVTGKQSESLKQQTLIRRMALDRQIKGFGYPTAMLVPEGSDLYLNALSVALGIAKYAGLIVIPNWQMWQLLPLLTLRQNIYTDPQKPLQVEGGIYKVGEPTDKSPVYVTTNFSLTYFMLTTEIDASGQPGWLVIVEAEGMSVLTAWSAGKFGGATVGKAILESGIADKIAHRKIILPGYVAVIKGDAEDALPGWDVMVGPQEASDVSAFVKDVWMELKI
ncbi:MAG: acetyl-CoA decarbonylase/synthase complex subunit gamma [bacterium]|nr:acetyl-CoA decarbonylase/synthase complex subunit gamma [bacterium]